MSYRFYIFAVFVIVCSLLSNVRAVYDTNSPTESPNNYVYDTNNPTESPNNLRATSVNTENPSENPSIQPSNSPVVQ